MLSLLRDENGNEIPFYDPHEVTYVSTGSPMKEEYVEIGGKESLPGFTIYEDAGEEIESQAQKIMARREEDDAVNRSS